MPYNINLMKRQDHLNVILRFFEFLRIKLWNCFPSPKEDAIFLLGWPETSKRQRNGSALKAERWVRRLPSTISVKQRSSEMVWRFVMTNFVEECTVRETVILFKSYQRPGLKFCFSQYTYMWEVTGYRFALVCSQSFFMLWFHPLGVIS